MCVRIFYDERSLTLISINGIRGSYPYPYNRLGRW